MRSAHSTASAPRVGTRTLARVATAIQPEASLSLKQALTALGMPLAFDRNAADFTGIANPVSPADGLYISDVIHKAFVEVSEQGTEAAAATAVVMMTRGLGVGGEVFNADHPFLFLIHTRENNAVLFMGRLADPR